MNDLSINGTNLLSMLGANRTPSSQIAEFTPEASNSSSSSSQPFLSAFEDILEEAITGATKAAATVASKRVAEFVEDRSRLKFIAQAAGWAPSSSGSGSSSSSSSSSNSVNTNDPVYRLITALGKGLIQTLDLGDETGSTSTTSTAGMSQNTTSQTTTDQTGTGTTGTTTTDTTTTDTTQTDDTQSSEDSTDTA